MSITIERDYQTRDSSHFSRDGSASYSGSSSDLIDCDSDVPPSTRSRLGPVKTFSAALLEEFNGPPPREEPLQQRQKALRSFRSEDVLSFSRSTAGGFNKSVSSEVPLARRRRELPYSRSARNWDSQARESDFLPPPQHPQMMRSYSNQERGSYHHSRYQRRTPPPPIAAPRDIIVIVENLPDEYKPKDIRRLFLPFGNVDNKIRLSSGVARVTFTDMRSADECVKTLHGYPLSGKRLSLKFV